MFYLSLGLVRVVFSNDIPYSDTIGDGIGDGAKRWLRSRFFATYTEQILAYPIDVIYKQLLPTCNARAKSSLWWSLALDYEVPAGLLLC